MDVARYIALRVLFSLGIVDGIRIAMRSRLVLCNPSNMLSLVNVSEGYRSVYGVCVKHNGDEGRFRYTIVINMDKGFSVHSYFDMMELGRRISHEITHLYAFHRYAGEGRTIHQYIDRAVADGREAEMVSYMDMPLRLNGRVINLKVYDVRDTCRRALEAVGS